MQMIFGGSGALQKFLMARASGAPRAELMALKGAVISEVAQTAPSRAARNEVTARTVPTNERSATVIDFERARLEREWESATHATF